MIPPKFIEKHAHFLRQICDSRRRRIQEELIKSATDEQLLCLVEICLNILKGRVPLRKVQLKKLQRQARGLRKLSRTRSSRSAKRILLHQEGHGLPAIAGLLGSIIVPLIADAISKKQINKVNF